jgi:hypothetical protein
LDYPAAGGCPSLLVEPAATNLLTYSEEFDTVSWAKQAGGVASAPVVTANAEISPDGTMNADSVVFNLNGGALSADFSQITSATITHAAAAHTQSIYARTTDGTNKVFSFVTPGGTLLSITITPNWQRFTATSSAAGAGGFRLRLRGTEGTASSATIAIWGAQYETGSVATSYIPTVAATATRNADVISKTGVSGFIGQSQGTIYAEVDLRNAAFPKALLAVSDGTLNNRINISFESATSLFVTLRVASANLDYSATIPAIPAIGGIYKAALAYQANNFALALNGTTYTPTSPALVPALSAVFLGQSGGGGNILRDRIRAAAIYTTRLEDDELIALTTL